MVKKGKKKRQASSTSTESSVASIDPVDTVDPIATTSAEPQTQEKEEAATKTEGTTHKKNLHKRQGQESQQQQQSTSEIRHEPSTSQHTLQTHQQSAALRQQQQAPQEQQKSARGPQQHASQGQQQPEYKGQLRAPHAQQQHASQGQQQRAPQEQQKPARGPQQHASQGQQQRAPQEQQKPARGPQQHTSQGQQQRAPQEQQKPAWGPQQHASQGQQQRAPQEQQKPAWGPQQHASQGQQQRAPQEQQKPAWGPHQHASQGQQQRAPQEQQKPAWGPQQHASQGQQQRAPQEQQKPAWGPQQHASQGQQQRAPQEQQKPAWGPQQHASQGQQQRAPQEQQKPAWGPQQHASQGQQQRAPQEQQKPAWGSQQHASQGQQQRAPQEQQKPAWGPQQHASQGQQQHAPQEQQKPAWGPQQHAPQRQQQQIPSKSSVPKTSTSRVMRHSGTLPKESDDFFQKSSTPANLKISSDIAKQMMMQIPTRPNPSRAGSLGQVISVETNMFKVMFKPGFVTNAVHYDIVFEPDRPKFLLRTIFEELRKKHFRQRHPAFDGKKNIYSGNDLPFGESMETEVRVIKQDLDIDKTFKVKIKKVAEIDLSWLKTIKPGLTDEEKNNTSIQALDVILRHGPASQSITVGRSLFSNSGAFGIRLSGGMEAWVGSFQSAILGWKSPYLNVDVTHKGFLQPENVLSLMYKMLEKSKAKYPVNVATITRNKETLSQQLKGVKVQYQIPNIPSSKRTQRINGLVESPRESRFAASDGRTYTVEEYFQVEKKYQIQNPLAPCLWIGSLQKRIYVPPELCTVMSGQVRHKLDETQTTELIRYAVKSPNLRKDKIRETFNALKLNESLTMQNEFQLSVNGEMLTVEARVLNAPQLEYSRPVKVRRGVWNPDRFKICCNLKDNSWTILKLDSYALDSNIHHLVTGLQNYGSQLGMNIGKPLAPYGVMEVSGRNIDNIVEFFEQKKQQGLRLVIVIIPEYNDAYSKVKKISELKVGLLTQCLRGRTVNRLDPKKIQNILLKINSKLNGTNHIIMNDNTSVRCLKRSTCMIIGADVTHPSPDATNIPSIAAVVASHDIEGFQYNAEIRLQPPKTEIVLDLEDIVLKQARYFRKMTGRTPQRVIFYRDGVSEGDLPRVMFFELRALRNAFQKFADVSPPITFLVVQKRHHTRFFLGGNDNNNVQAGTIVDTTITHPSHIDFYLVSHASIQGTARPTKYRCLCNENNFTEDEIEELTYYLCHMYSRCTRSVSYPTPTYYAHLAAFRARTLIQNEYINLNNLGEAQKKINLHKEMNMTPMFFV